MNLPKPLCKKCLFLNKWQSSPSRKLKICQPLKTSKVGNVFPQSIDDYARRVDMYPIEIDIQGGSFDCLMEAYEKCSRLSQKFLEEKYLKFKEEFESESEEKILKRDEAGRRELMSLYKQSEQAEEMQENNFAYDLSKRPKVKLRIVLKRPPILDDDVCLFLGSKESFGDDFTVTPFGAKPIPYFKFGCYKNRYINTDETLILLRKWSHEFNYVDITSDFIKAEVTENRKNFKSWTNSIRKFFKDSEKGMRSEEIRKLANTPGERAIRLMKKFHLSYPSIKKKYRKQSYS